jgi:nitroreductase
MELMEAIYGRRAVRSYTNKEVPRQAIRTLAEAAVQAPCALNKQAWAFGVFQGRELLKDFSDRAKLHFLEKFSPGSDPHVRTREMLTDPEYNIFYDAATLIVVFANPDGGQFAVGSCYLAAQNLMLAAHGMGLGTCPIGFAQSWLDLDEVKTELGIPVQYTAVLPMILGYPAGIPEKPARSQPEIFNWI